jgi:hypothetical protein
MVCVLRCEPGQSGSSNFVGLDRGPFIVVRNLRDQVIYPLLRIGVITM